MSKFNIAAQRLRTACTQGAIAPLRDILDPTDADGAYAVQAVNTRFWEAMGRRVVGRKVGLTAKAVQAQLGVDQPDFGVLFADMEVPDGGTDLPAHEIGEAEMLAAIAEAAAAIEIVDSRIADWKITFADTVADNGSSALFVLSKERRSLAGLDLWSCGMVLERNGEVASLGAGAACLGHPIKAATWLANTLAARGEPLRKGDIILTGALGPMVPLSPGDEIRVTIGGLGAVSFSYKD
jgi:2-keto-4-pentenoate hydratase